MMHATESRDIKPTLSAELSEELFQQSSSSRRGSLVLQSKKNLGIHLRMVSIEIVWIQICPQNSSVEGASAEGRLLAEFLTGT